MASKDKRKNRTFTYLLLLIVILAITIGILVYLLVTKTKNNIRCSYSNYLLQRGEDKECVSCKEPEKCNKFNEYIDYQNCNQNNPVAECKPCGFKCPLGKKFGKCPPAPKGIFPYNCCCV